MEQTLEASVPFEQHRRHYLLVLIVVDVTKARKKTKDAQ
jgi:hypothetical protein